MVMVGMDVRVEECDSGWNAVARVSVLDVEMSRLENVL
jgi:hypothetical protein